jgi:hypothetical protein
MMDTTLSFNDILQLVESLADDEQKLLIDLVNKRRIERKRDEIAANIIHSTQEYEQGNIFRGTADEVIAELMSVDFSCSLSVIYDDVELLSISENLVPN